MIILFDEIVSTNDTTWIMKTIDSNHDNKKRYKQGGEYYTMGFFRNLDIDEMWRNKDIDQLNKLLQHGDENVRMNAAGTLRSLAKGGKK